MPHLMPQHTRPRQHRAAFSKKRYRGLISVFVHWRHVLWDCGVIAWTVDKVSTHDWHACCGRSRSSRGWRSCRATTHGWRRSCLPRRKQSSRSAALWLPRSAHPSFGPISPACMYLQSCHGMLDRQARHSCTSLQISTWTLLPMQIVQLQQKAGTSDDKLQRLEASEQRLKDRVSQLERSLEVRPCC